MAEPPNWEGTVEPATAPPLVLGGWDTQQSSGPEKVVVTKRMPPLAAKVIPGGSKPRSKSLDHTGTGPEIGQPKRLQIGPPPDHPETAEGLPLELLASVVQGVVQEHEKKKLKSPHGYTTSSVIFQAPQV